MAKQESKTWAWTIFEHDPENVYRAARAKETGIVEAQNDNVAKAKATKDADVSTWGQWLPNPLGNGYIRQKADVFTANELKIRPRALLVTTYLKLTTTDDIACD